MPAQTRAFLFCDLRGYSAFTDAHGDRAARELLAAYRASVREVIATFDGSEIRTEGDSFYVVFASVSHAVEAGLAILAHLEAISMQQPDRPIHAGIGVHAGETEDSEEGIVSTAVNIAARICAIAQPGELLVSDTVRALTRGYLEVGFTPRGERRLKGIAEPVRLYRVTATAPSAAAARRTLSGRWLAAGGAAVLIVGVVLAGTAILNGGLAAAQPTPQPSTSSSASSIASATASGSVEPGLAFPNAEEAALLARLPASLTTDCVRADADEIPDYQYGVHAMTTLPHHAALRCPFGGGIDAFFFASVGPSAAETTLFGYAGRRGAESGSCAGDGPATEHWSSGRAEGWVLCGADAFWTYDGTNVLGRANGGRDAGVVMDWWRENARFPVE